MSGRFSCADLKHLHHKGNGIILLEPLRHGLLEDGRRKRPERFAPLDLAVQNCLHVGPARIAHDRPVAQRAGPPLHSSLKPADHLAVGNRGGGAPAEFCFVRDRLDRRNRPPDLAILWPQSALLFRISRIAGPNRRDPSRTIALAAELVPKRERSADRAAGIARCRLHIDASKRRHPPHLAVGHRVHGATAGESQICEPVSLCSLPMK